MTLLTSRPQPLVIVGAGGFARETVETVRAINAVAPKWELLGFVDDNPDLKSLEVQGLPVLGPVAMVQDFDDFSVVVCTGRPDNYFSRKKLVKRLDLPLSRYATVVHPTASLAPSTSVGRGTVILAGVVVTASVHIGRHVVVMPGAVFTHDDHLANFVTVASGVRLGGGVRVGEGAYLGSGVLVRESRKIGSWALVGMGAVVTKDIPRHEVWVGVPARKISDVEVPADMGAPRRRQRVSGITHRGS
jgi:sugar O-acyltransferase (sialic acid O-acetyltransferase NeuD family)